MARVAFASLPRRVAQEVNLHRRIVIAALAVVIAVVVIVLVFTGGGTHRFRLPYRTLPKPPLPPTEKAPPPGCRHAMGGCLPQPKSSSSTKAAGLIDKTSFVGLTFVSTSSRVGPDFSNNNPAPASAFGAIAARSGFVYVKSVEGTGFTDGTAAGMAAAAKVHGLPVGGYDFLHVCGDGAVAEANHFVAAMRSQGLLGAHTLPPAADAEYGGSGCSVRVWLQDWVDTVYNQTGRCPLAYTGAWWWQPHVGAWWPTCRNVKLTSWVSGYGVSYPYMPAGESTLNLWQYTDAGFNGYSNADLSKWYSGSYAAFVASAPTWWKPNLAKLDHTRHRLHGRRIDERDSIRVWAADHCLNPVRRPVCKRIRVEVGYEKARIDFLAGHGPGPRYRKLAHPNWSRGRPGSYGGRNQTAQHVLTMTKGALTP